jgi:cell division septation protein DedD
MKYAIQKIPLIIGIMLFLLTIDIATISAESTTKNSAFHNISLTTAKQLAAAEGKNIFLEFYASWCVPCKWMEETTLSDENVQNYLSENYIALRIDIDDFDGYAVKQHYGIKVLPSILIVDSKGFTLERKEQSMTAKMLLDLLGSQTGARMQAPVNSSPKSVKLSKQTTEEPIVDVPLKDEKIANHATVKTTVYRVQVGVFTDYANTQKLVEELRLITEEPVVVLNQYLQNKMAFKVLIGDFEDRVSATSFKNQLLEKYGIDGYVK